jgi:hypothetical protein
MANIVSGGQIGSCSPTEIRAGAVAIVTKFRQSKYVSVSKT